MKANYVAAFNAATHVDDDDEESVISSFTESHVHIYTQGCKYFDWNVRKKRCKILWMLQK